MRPITLALPPPLPPPQNPQSTEELTDTLKVPLHLSSPAPTQAGTTWRTWCAEGTHGAVRQFVQNEWCALIAQPGVVVAAFPAWVVMLSTPNAGSDVEHIPRHSGSAGARTLKVVDDRTVAARALAIPSGQLCVMLGLVLVAALLSSWPSLGERNQGVCSSGQAELWFDGAVAIRRGYGLAKGGDVVLHVVGMVHLEAPAPHDHSVQLQARTFNVSGAPLCPM